MADDSEPQPAPGPRNAQDVAASWVASVMEDGDLRAAWPITDSTLRLVLVQDWVWSHRHHPDIGHDADWDGIARGLAACPPEHPLWERFATELVELWQKIWRGFSTERWVVWDEPEVLGLDLEMVSFIETEGDVAPSNLSRATFARRFALRHGDQGWAVAGINGEQMFVPGWPPSLADQPL